ncbi:MAG: nucleotidyltransferase domain-containing protein [Clostridia bacterium]|nr:nucleotidyltransferase domain-containing protein [Clostridia bacterium]
MDIQAWMTGYTDAVQAVFPGRVRFIGLQGSRGRGEARPDSDIDAVLILDRLEDADLETYAALLDKLPYRELICGFTAGMDELATWEKFDLIQLILDTTPFVGSLDELMATVAREDWMRAVRIGAGNIYHICNHNRLHGKKPRTAARLYKDAVFVLQAKGWLETGIYARRLDELIPLLSGEDAAVAQCALSLRHGGEAPSLEVMSAQLRAWAASQLRYASITD